MRETNPLTAQPAILGHNANEGASSGVFNETSGPSQATKDGFQAAIGCPVVLEAR